VRWKKAGVSEVSSGQRRGRFCDHSPAASSAVARPGEARGRTRGGITEQRRAPARPAGEIRTPPPMRARVVAPAGAVRRQGIGDRSQLLIPAWPVARRGKTRLLYYAFIFFCIFSLKDLY